jgi:hypothetical protein
VRKAFFLLILLAFMAFPVFVLPRLLIIKNITCVNQFGFCSSYLAEEIEKEEGKSLSQVKKDLGKVLGSQIQVADFSFKFNLPDKLKVYLVERKGVMALNYNGDFYLVDNDYYVIAKVEETNLPTVFVRSGVYDFQVGEKIPGELMFAGEILQKLFISYTLKIISWEENRLEASLDNGITVIFPLSGKVDVLVGSLRVILSQLNTASQDTRIKANTIDLRFDNPVVR